MSPVLLLSLAASCLLLLSPWPAAGESGMKDSAHTAPTDADPPGRPILNGCGLDGHEAVISQLLKGSSQKRTEISCSPLLQRYAEYRAEDMASRGYLSHTPPGRHGPNQMLREFGYPLPDQYLGGQSNGVESIAGGIESPQAVWQALLASPTHRPHLLGEGPGFAEQNEFGVAYRKNIRAPHVDYWVIVIARQQMPEDPSLICTPPPAVCFQVGATDGANVPQP